LPEVKATHWLGVFSSNFFIGVTEFELIDYIVSFAFSLIESLREVSFGVLFWSCSWPTLSFFSSCSGEIDL
jgi:hypothetical protein